MARLPNIVLSLLLCHLQSLPVEPLGSSGVDDVGEDRAARMYDEAIKLCAAGSRVALKECNSLLLQSIQLVPNQALASLTLGHTYRTLGSWGDAVHAFSNVRHCTRARAGSPEVAPAWAKEDAGVHFGRALIELDRWDEAIEAFEATYMTFPANSEALFRHLYLQHFACNFTRRTELLQEVRERMLWEVETRGTSMMTPSQALMMLEGHELRMIAQAYAAGHLAAAAMAAKPHGAWEWTLDASLLDAAGLEAESRKTYFAYSPMHMVERDGRLRIGYVSKDMGFSSVGQLLPRLLSAHNRRRLQVHVYSLNPSDGTPTRKMLEEGTEHWHQLNGTTSLKLAELVNSDGINIAIDLGGHLSPVAQVALALQPAPIAVNYLSWLASSGAPYIQTFVTDPVVSPPEFAHLHSESLSFLPFSYQVNSNRYMHNHHYNAKARYTLLHPPHQPQGPPANISEHAIIFANFNQLFKVDAQSKDAWRKILEAVPNSVMAMLNFSGLGAPEGTLRLQHALFPRLQHQHALTPHAHHPHNRLLFSPFCASKHDFLTLSGGADVFLDNLFYNAGTTGSDVLFAGLPVLTSPGSRTLARMGASLGAAAGYTGLVVRNVDEYVALAIALGRRPAKLARIKALLQRRQASASLFDVDRWVHAYEALLYTLWDAALTGHLRTGGGQATKGQRNLVIARPA